MSAGSMVPISESDLHAYADARLSAARRLEVEAWLEAQPEERARVASWMRDNEALRARFDPVLREPIPMRIATRPAATLPWLRVAAAVAFTALGVAGGWFLRGAAVDGRGPGAVAASAPHMALPGRAAMAHAVYSPEVRRPVEVSAKEEQQLVAWLSKRMEAPIKAPHLRALGYELMGGRLLPGERGPAAQFMYQDGAGRRLTLYVAREPQTADTAFRFESAPGVNTFYWIDAAFGYAISGNVEREELQKLAHETYGQLAGRQPR